MTTTVSMPQLGESVTEGTVTRWLKQVGDTITADEPLLEVSTDKVDTEIPSPVSGVLLEIVAGEDAVVLVGGALAVIGDADGSAAAPVVEPVAAPVVEAPVVEATAVIDIPTPAPTVTAVPAGSGSNVSVVLPALGESVTEGTVTRWLKQIGDKVAVDEALLEVSTDKVDTEIPSPVEGVLLEITVAEDGVAAVGGQLGVIGTLTPASAAPVAPVSAPSAPAPVVSAPVAPSTPAPAASSSAEIAAANAGAYATPLVRRLAAERGVDLSTVVGTGVGGRVRKEDVLATNPTQVPVAQSFDRPVASTPAAPALAAPAASSAPTSNAPAAPAAKVPTGAELRGNTVPMTRLRKVIAERMVESLRVSAQLTSVVEVDVTRIAALRNRSKNAFFEREGVKLSFLPFFAKAACEALKTFPVVNATIDQAAGTVTYFDAEHMGIAVDTERGLLVPVIHNAGDLNIGGLSRKISDLAERTRTNKLSPDELSGGTFTLTNTGSRGALFDTPILNQPQVAILGTGAVVKRPVVVTDENGQDVISVRQMVYLALTYDHRLVDGADAARFLSAIKARLEEGAFEADLGL
ncbi:MAG: 2-oxoglutarate dehydrogenase, E2 component, dihydrolipoamide succinyltransferase [Actinomycetes bacterium]